MKSYFVILSFLLCFSFGVFSQNKITVRVAVTQPDSLELDAKGEPSTVGDISKFEVKGGTPPYSDYTWTEATGEDYNYKVTIKDSNNCSASIYVNVTGTSIEEIEFAENAYPNPTSDIVNIPMPSNEEKVVIMIINIEGKVLYKNTVKVTDSSYPLTLASCNAGRYFIQVVGSSTKTYSIIKK